MKEKSPSPRRAWIEIFFFLACRRIRNTSPSPRRAWIEMVGDVDGINRGVRRPPHGGRGLKSRAIVKHGVACVSPSPRRAWIEMKSSAALATPPPVALPTEGVD